MRKYFVLIILAVLLIGCKEDESDKLVTVNVIWKYTNSGGATKDYWINHPTIYTNLNGKDVEIGYQSTYNDQALISSDNVSVSVKKLSNFTYLLLTNKEGKEIGRLTNNGQSITLKSSDLE